MAEKEILTRIQHKYDTQTNWNKATGFTPKKGELIIYSDIKKFKVGDGSSKLSALQFYDIDLSSYATKAYADQAEADALAAAKTYANGLATNYATAAQGSKADTALQPSDIAAAAKKNVDASISAGSTSANLPTSAAVASFVEGKGYTKNTGTVTSVVAGGGLAGGTITGSGTISHGDTSSQASVTASGRKYITGVTLDTYGHVTGLTTGTETVTDTNTTYDLAASASASNGNVKLNLTAGGSGSGTDSVTIKGSGATTVTTDASGNITISSTDTNTDTDTGATSVEVTGSGNAITAATYDASSRKITLTKGATYNNYSLPNAGTSLGGVKTGGVATISGGQITAISKATTADSATTATSASTATSATTATTANKVANSLTIQGNGTSAVSFNGSSATTVNIKGAGSTSVSASNGTVTITGATIPTSLKNPNKLTIGSKTYDGSSAVTVSAGDLGLSNALHFIGTVTSLPTTGTNGDVVLMGSKEYVYSDGWVELGDGNSHALKTVTISAGGGLTGGGDLTTNRTISHADTSSQASITASGRKYITGVTLDGYGHVTALTTGTETVTNTDTTYDLAASKSSTNGNVKVNLTASGSGSGTDSITIKGSGATTVTTDANGVITINSTDNNTTYSAGTGISLSGTTFSNSGVRSISTGSSNGTISVNTNGTSAEVPVKGLGTAAYTASTAYATAAQGTKADNALPKSGGTLTGNLTMDNSATAQTGEPYIQWATIGSNKPYTGFAHDQTDGTFIICSMEKDDSTKKYTNGLAIGGGSGSLFWKGIKIATTADIPTLSSLGAVPTSRTVNGKALTGNISLTASDVGAAPSYTYSTTDLTAGTSALTTGQMYLVYE